MYAGRERILRGLEFRSGVRRDRRRRADQRLPVQRADQSTRSPRSWRSSPRRRAACARPALDGVELAGANGDALHAVPRARRSTTARTSTAARSRTARASRSRSSGRSAPRSATTSASASRSASTRRLTELLPWMRAGNSVEESSQVCRWLEEAGVDYLHVSAGTGFPHPAQPGRPLPGRGRGQDLRRPDLERPLRAPELPRLPHLAAQRRSSAGGGSGRSRKLGIEGINLPDSRAVKEAVSIPVLCTGGFQTASVIADAIERGDCDGVTIARPLVANPDLVRHFEQGHDQRAAAVHVLQQVPLRLRREPARLLRGAPLRLARGDDRRDLLRLPRRPA